MIGKRKGISQFFTERIKRFNGNFQKKNGVGGHPVPKWMTTYATELAFLAVFHARNNGLKPMLPIRTLSTG